MPAVRNSAIINQLVRSANFIVVAIPKLEREIDLLQLRERYAPSTRQLEPHIRITSPWVPAELGEIMAVIEFISRIRRGIHPLAISAENWQEIGELILAPVINGAAELLKIRQTLIGSEPLPLINPESESAPSLILLRVPDRQQRALAVAEANRIGRTLGVIDSLTLVQIFSDGAWQRLARFPFGIGRVDFYDHLLR